MRFVLSTTVQAHTFDAAKALRSRGHLAALFAGYPARKLAGRGLAGPEVRTYPAPVLTWLAANRVVKNSWFQQRSEAWPKVAFDRHVARRLPDADVLVATSSVGLFSGRAARARGMAWVCDRPACHIVTQNQLLAEEYERHGLRWPGIHPAVIERELAEYEEADAVLVASEFARRSFLDHGFDDRRLWVVPYGIDLRDFYPEPREADGRFTVLFVGQVSLQKGVGYLIDAFKRVTHPQKRLIIVGSWVEETDLFRRRCGSEAATFTGAVPRDQLRRHMSEADVLVLPSIQDGYGMVVDQAMACGCPCIVSDHAGSADTVRDGVNGFVFPARDVDALAARLQRLADDPDLRAAMREAAVAAAGARGGWDAYADNLTARSEALRR